MGWRERVWGETIGIEGQGGHKVETKCRRNSQDSVRGTQLAFFCNQTIFSDGKASTYLLCACWAMEVQNLRECLTGLT